MRSAAARRPFHTIPSGDLHANKHCLWQAGRFHRHQRVSTCSNLAVWSKFDEQATVRSRRLEALPLLGMCRPSNSLI